MSLVSYIQRPEVAARIKPFRPPPPRKINASLKVEPRTDHWSLVGTAFDYFLRFELKRRARHDVWKMEREGYTAEIMNLFSSYIVYPVLKEQVAACGWTEFEFTSTCDLIEQEARGVCSTFVGIPSPTSLQLQTLAGHAIRLARLEPIRRAGRIDETIFDDPEPADIEDLMELLAVVPFEDLTHGTNLLLNPSFGESSSIVGGADVDLISGDRLIDFKTTKKGEMEVKYLDQIFGWFLMARRERRLNSKFPEINKLGLYFCRHGHLWLREASEWTSKPGFQQLEEWFYDHAREVYSQRTGSI
jgi:hypothetical protein